MKKLRGSLVLKLVAVVITAHIVMELTSGLLGLEEVPGAILETLVLSGITYFFGRRLCIGLREMISVSRKIAENDFTQKVTVRTNDEVGTLAQAFNRMAESLHGSFEDLQLKNEYIGGLNRNFEVVTTELEAVNRALGDAQEQLVQSDKMASVGQLAAGVAHEINNPMGFINSNLGSLEGYMRDIERLLKQYESLEKEIEHSTGETLQEAMEAVQALKKEIDISFLLSDLQQLVKESRDGADRVKKIVQDLKEFSHVDRAECEYVNLHNGLDSTLNIAWNELKYKAEVIKEYGEIPEIPCYPQQINQVFMNLLINAVHAIPEKGEIRIRTFAGEKDVVVEISDTGVGMSEETQKKIFDPFFTTKPVGKGTGLGLSIVYGIIQRHKGRVEVQSRVGQGTTFRIFLPKESEMVNAQGTGLLK